MRKPKWLHTIQTCSCDDIHFKQLPKYMDRQFVTECSDKMYRIVGVFVGYDKNSWVAIVDTHTHTDRQLLLYTQFISRFRLVTETKKCYCHMYPRHYHH